ncbi:ferrous iron transporter B [Caenimonas koreensis DSM 17982]|uniref:Fe(2+) transporter FeoB n=1 Tax=Caenimonas koreensis DSM 17982 TaxID=1121255 RepID=A0A844BBV0_9BURK|nr:ferrous iron transporter B [Caenimonas koreensis]MRD49099.1 ferrous iron transporter B [Caenimonas koreensis DSM 17982]
MTESVIHVHPPGRLVALVGNPNCGKTALFNLLTGSRQKVANYAGVTVERKEGRMLLPTGKSLRVLDLPGTYSLNPRSPDEQVTCGVLQGVARGEKRPDIVVCVVDATNLRRSLRLVLSVLRLGLPCVIALNMADLAADRGMRIDPEVLSRELGVPVVGTVAVDSTGAEALQRLLSEPDLLERAEASIHANLPANAADDANFIRDLLVRMGLDDASPHLASDAIDRVVLHPVWGLVILAVTLFLIFQAVFSWAEAPMNLIKDAAAATGAWVNATLPEGFLRSFIVDGLVAGLGSVLVFLPQILILFFFILMLEESGYLPRAAFLLDRVMGTVGLSGRSFIPLLSSFACAIPGIMATRTIANARDRLVTIMIAPMMTCSARLPVYALLIGAFIPERVVGPGVQLRGLVLFLLYVAGIAGSMGVAWLLKRFTSQGRQVRPLMMELPSYHMPRVRNIALGLWQRTQIFLRRVGGVILVLTIALWVLASFPQPPVGATGSPIEYSIAGMLGHALAVVFQPIGFNWQISVALVPGMAAREVAVSALGTVYSLAATTQDTAGALAPIIAQQWSLPTALSLLAWYVFAPQCLSTLAAVKRETGGLKWPLVMAGYLFALAYLASFITYNVAKAMSL